VCWRFSLYSVSIGLTEAPIAVAEGAKEGATFLQYVEYLAKKGYVPPKGTVWVDHIRKIGNEATHEIVLMTKYDAEDLISFVEMLLKFIYEFPNQISVQIEESG
jgi:hypothetical protein